MGKLLLYPFHTEMSPICRFSDCLSEYDGVLAVAPKSFGIHQWDAGRVDGGEQLAILVTNDFSASLMEAQAVYIDYAEAFTLSPEHYLTKINQALEYNKQVLVSDRLFQYIKGLTSDKFSERVRVIGCATIETPLQGYENTFEIPVPCISVLGAGDQTNKFDLQLGLRRYFTEAGYKVYQLGTKEYSSLFGFDALPRFLFEAGNQREKILRLNHFIYDRVLAEQADLVIIGCPGGIMRHDPFEFDEYGEMAFLIGNAIKTDVSILSLYGIVYTNEALSTLRDICKYRLNAPVSRFNLACKNIVVDQALLKCRYATVDASFIQEQVLPSSPSRDFEITCGLLSGETDRLAQSIESELLANV